MPDEMPQWFMEAWTAHQTRAQEWRTDIEKQLEEIRQDMNEHRWNAHGNHRRAQVKDWGMKAGAGGGLIVLVMEILGRLFGVA